MDTDTVMRKIWLCVSDDLQDALGGNSKIRDYTNVVLNSACDARDFVWPGLFQADPYLFKCVYQAQNFFKRYKFKVDKYTHAELETLSVGKFFSTQDRISNRYVRTKLLDLVLNGARNHASRILGTYDLEEHQSLCRFGKRAVQGLPYKESYLDTKIRMGYSGSEGHISFFKRYLESDDLLKGHFDSSSNYDLRTCLKLALVPKSYKALRVILPDTLSGSFYTAGLGAYLVRKLRTEGLDISSLQNRHRYLVNRASVTGNLVTADLSSASDSISLQLLEDILPGEWYNSSILGRIPECEYKGILRPLNSPLTMGLGHTFPLQTLVFYALLKSIGDLSGKPYFISVYGDDLVYSRHMHRYVALIFPKLHLILNGDKTYVTVPFRESCGSDFYRGVDVRPFSFEGEYTDLTGHRYQAFLHTVFNGLRRRWSWQELPRTKSFLLSELARYGKIFQIPPSYPDYAGIHTDKPEKGIMYHDIDLHAKTWSSKFKVLGISAPLRRVSYEFPYYWERLRTSLDVTEPYDPYSDISDSLIFRFRKRKKRGGNTRKEGWYLLEPCVSVKGHSKLLEQDARTSKWE